jgi:hypothetical protein
MNKIGKEHFFATQKEAISKIISEADQSICRNCKNHVFKQCPTIVEV